MSRGRKRSRLFAVRAAPNRVRKNVSTRWYRPYHPVC